MGSKFSLDDYITVNERLAKFWNSCPGGRIETSVAFPTGPDRVYVSARVYRKADDPFPAATGTSQMVIPGLTPYTKNAEVENAETSAVGRALALMGFEINKSIASREEVEKNLTHPDNNTVEGEIVKVEADYIVVKAGSTTYQVPCDPTDLPVGNRVRVIGSIEMVPWKQGGKAMPPYKRINATTIEEIA